MTEASERNEKAEQLVAELLQDASAESLDDVPSNVKDDLLTVVNSPALGFREVTLVVAIAGMLDGTYKSSKDFYACSPRGLYEKGIRPALQAAGVPCRQSGPLNVAKSAKALDDGWAAQKKPKDQPAAKAVVRLALFSEVDQSFAKNLAMALAYHLSLDAEETRKLHSKAPAITDLDRLFTLCRSFIEKTPDKGNTPQRVCGYLLDEALGDSNLEVLGATDSASTTNKTANKPGDLCVFAADGSLIAAYEVTVKGFTEQRIRECSQSLEAYQEKSGQSVATVRVLCRPEDVPEVAATNVADRGGILGIASDGEFTYEFVDLFSWIAIQLSDLSEAQRTRFFEKLRDYVNEPSIPKATKIAFAELAGGTPRD